MLSKDDNMNKGPIIGMWGMMKTFGLAGLCLGIAMFVVPTQLAFADTEVTAADYSAGSDGDVKIVLQTVGDVPPVSVFETESPARIVLDLAATQTSVGTDAVSVGLGPVQSFTTLSAGDRTRVMVELSHPATYDYQAEDGQVVLTIAGEAAMAEAPAAAATTYMGHFNVENVDFRRGEEGQSRVIVSMDKEGANFSSDTGMGKLTVDIYDATLPDDLNQLLDVVDFATPVQIIDVAPSGQGTRLEMSISGDYEHLAYQSGNELIIEVAQHEEEVEQQDPYELQFYEDKEYTGTRVTFNFQDIPVRSVLQLIADVSNLNIVVADNVSGNLTLRLTNVPWDQALDIILDARNLDQRTNGNVIWIAPAADIAAREQQLLQALQDRKELEPLQTVLLDVSYATAEDLKSLIEESSSGDLGDKGLLSERGSVSIDARTNTLLVTDTPDRIAEIQRLIKELDRPVEQVQIESRIVVANSDFSHELGVRFGVTTLHSGSNILAIAGDGAGADLLNPATNPRDDGLLDLPGIPQRYNVNLPASDSNAGTIGLSFLSGDYLLDLELSALEAEGEGEVVSTPRVVTANQAEAFIQQGVEIPYQQASSSGATNVSFKEAVLELRVTPLITPDDRIQLELAIKQDTVGEIFQTGTGGSVPSIDTRELQTSVLVNNGETVVLGGIFQDERTRNEDRVPYLSSIPGLGNLFKRRANEAKKRELLVFVTPTIVQERPVVN
jgi:type IV pilus assembly protein PilQ